nr:titin [Leptinotarsa decemlineata]
MESPARKVKKAKRDPRVPIKTYKWEDVKRSRSKGGYPWTYLYKEPFDEELDPEPYTMEGMRKSKSSSTMGKSDVEISEVMDTDTNPHAEEPHEKSDELQIITEPDEHSIKRSNSSLVIEECDGNDKDKQSPGIFFLESAESSDDISQYLDKEDRSPTGKRKNQETPMEVTMAEEKEEEPQTRKRKLSAESSYSRISQTKSAILKKIKDTKAKIKVPKISFPTSKLKKSPPKKKTNTPPETKKEIKKNNTPQNTKPLYIHIPLKPLPGEEDEFSHLELGSDQTKKHQPKKPGSFKDLVKNLKQLKDVKNDSIKEEMETEGATQTDISTERTSKGEEANEDEDTETVEDTNVGETKTENKKDAKVKKESKLDKNIKAQTITKKEIVVDEEKGKKTEEDTKVHVDSKQTDFKMKTDPVGKEESVVDIKVETNIIENKRRVQADGDSDTKILVKNEEVNFEMKDEARFYSPEHQSHQQQGLSSFGEVDPINFKRRKSPEDPPNMEVMEPEEENDNVAQVEEAKYNDMFDKLFAATTSKSDAETQSERKGRSKSAEPERKRKVSLESSYSRKSLSRLGVMKKLKDASDKIKNALTRSSSKKEVKPKEEKIVKKSKQLKPLTPVEPVYIHIPLKPPEGEKDEFSHVQAEEGLKTPDTDSTTTDSPVQSGVQFIFLTAPSDEEVLDYNSSDVPETPSSENKRFFGSRISELRELAKGAVDEIACPKHKLESVSEEGSDKFSVEEGNNRQESEVVTLPEDENARKEVKDSARNVEIESNSDPIGIILKEKATSKDSEKEAIQVDEEDGLSEPKTMKKDNFSEEKLEDDKKPLQVQNEANLPETTASTEKEETTGAQSLELRSSLKGDGSPVMKKKVSFKRRSKVSKEGSYEDIQVISSDGDEGKELKFPRGGLDNTQSMSVDEEKSYLDDKIVKNSSLEEDYNKWSKISDHEYEPVNPPPENVEIIPRVKISENPTVCIINSDQISNNSQSYNFAEEEAYKQDPAFLLKFQKNSKLVHSPSTKPKEDQSQIPLGEEAYMQDPAFLLKFQKDSKQVHRSGSREGPSKFQQAIKQRADNLKVRLHNIKKPHLSLPERPKFHKPNFQKFNLPKLPESAKINLPSFNLPRRNNAKRSVRERHLSTESNDGDSKKPIFDFSTYPRIFKKKPKDQDLVEEDIPSFATVPRKKKPDKPKTDDSRWSAGSDSVRVPLHSEDSMDADNGVDNNKESYIRGDSIEENEPSHIRYDEDIDSDDAYDRENRELNRERDFLKRWDQGTYNAEDHEYIENMRNKQPRITDLDSPEEPQEKDYPHFQGNNNGEHYSSGSSQGMHRQGVLEEINPDEFFLRQKGISQDNIEVGMYLSSEIREAFRTPVNALSQMQGNNVFELRDSNQSLPEMPVKRKSLKKPKRKKTPHTSQEKIIPYDEESAEDELGTFPPPRPTRRSRRCKKHKNAEDLIPYQETISLDIPDDGRLVQHRESLGILGDDEQDEEVTTYENEKMKGKEQPDISITDQYKNFEFADEEDVMEDLPSAPPRKQKSLKSLNMSESDSIMGDFSSNRAIFSSETDIHEPEIKAIRTGSKVIIPIETVVPTRPSRTLSRTNSQSRGTFQKDDENISLNTESLASENQIPCVEEPCLKDLRDSMGYAIIDKSKARDPPLPPPRIPTRRKRSFRNENDRNFFTVPRSSRNGDTPVRPLRNYSTLGHTKRGSVRSNTYENKENIDISQYIEIEDEPNRDLHSGAVIKKMKDRPLPPPPRPPRKSRPLRDITSQENIRAESNTELDKVTTEEAEVSTQTEPLPDDFICEEVVQEPTDTIIIPTKNQDTLFLPDNVLDQIVQVSTPERKAPLAVLDDQLDQETISKPINFQQETRTDKSISGQSNQVISKEGVKEEVETIISTPRREKPTIERRLITPTVYSYEETVTHGSLVVQPLDGAKLLPDTEISNMRTIPVHMEDDLEETSSIPEEFNKLTDPSPGLNPEIQIQSGVKPSEFDVLKAHKLQVSDLDVDKLTVSKLHADKIIVSEIDSSSIQTNEISSKTGALKVGEITLPPEVITQIIETIKSSQVEESTKSEVQKKTSISESPNMTDESPGGSRDPSETIIESPADIPETFKSPKVESPGVLEVQEGPAEGFIDPVSPSGQLHAQKSPLEELSVEESFSNEADLQERSQESPSRKICDLEGLSGDQNVPKDISEHFDVEERPSEEVNVQEKPPNDICTQESEHEMLNEPESSPRESKVLDCPLEEYCPKSSVLEDQTVNQFSRVAANIEERPPRPPPRYSDTTENINVSGNFAENLDVHESLPEEHGVQETPPKPPPRSSDANSFRKRTPPPNRPPRNSEKLRTGSSSTQEESLQEPDVDDVPPPRPPQPQLEYIPSQPPASFYALRAQKYVDTHGESIPTVPRRRGHAKSKQRSRSSSEESSVVTPPSRRFHRRSSDLSIATLSGQLVRVCGAEVNNSLRRLITYILNNVVRNEDGKQDLNVMIMIVVVLIAGLILLGYGDEKTVVHMHHWEYFNPPGDT